jgi:hypothetical protein
MPYVRAVRCKEPNILLNLQTEGPSSLGPCLSVKDELSHHNGKQQAVKLYLSIYFDFLVFR